MRFKHICSHELKGRRICARIVCHIPTCRHYLQAPRKGNHKCNGKSSTVQRPNVLLHLFFKNLLFQPSVEHHQRAAFGTARRIGNDLPGSCCRLRQASRLAYFGHAAFASSLACRHLRHHRLRQQALLAFAVLFGCFYERVGRGKSSVYKSDSQIPQHAGTQSPRNRT